MSDSRHFVPELTADLDRLADGRAALLAPSPGLWRDAPALGSLVRPGDQLGSVEILGVAHRLLAPEGAIGIVVEEGPHAELAGRTIDYGARLLTVDPEALGGALVADATASAAAVAADGSLLFTAPSSGRFYQRPAPDKPNFIAVGEVIERGQTVGLLEVMKTFTRINFDDPKLPARVKVVAIVAGDQADLAFGDVILRVEAVDG